MIYVIVSDNCPHCTEQKKIMASNFHDDEYKFIMAGSKEFEEFENIVDAVPFLLIKDEGGIVKYQSLGIHEGSKLRQLERNIRLNIS